MSEKDSIKDFNNEMRKALVRLYKKCKENKENKYVKAYKLCWSNGKKEELNIEDNKLIYIKNKLKCIEEKNDYLNYYWIEFLQKTKSYKISLFYKNFDSDTGNIHILPGAIQCWERVSDSMKEPIDKKSLRCGHGIIIYEEYGWKPIFLKPLLFRLNDNLIGVILEELILGRDNIVAKEITNSNSYYEEFISEREKRLQKYYERFEKYTNFNEENIKKRKGHYQKYALIEWLTNNKEFLSFQEIINYEGLGYFSKFGMETEQMFQYCSWELDYPLYDERNEKKVVYNQCCCENHNAKNIKNYNQNYY